MRAQDLRVSTQIILQQASQPSIVFEIGVVAKALDTAQYTQISDVSQFATFVDPLELPELEGGFIEGRIIHLWTTESATDFASLKEDMESKCKTIIFTVSQSLQYFSQNPAFLGVKVWTTDQQSPWDVPEIVEKAKQDCVVADFEKQGKALYTFLRLLESYPVVSLQTTINDSQDGRFTSIYASESHRNLLMNANITAWLEAESTFLWDFYIGGRQGQLVYAQLAVEEESKVAVYRWITSSANQYTSVGMLNLKTAMDNHISSKLVPLRVISEVNIFIPSVSLQMASDRDKGIVKGVKVSSIGVSRVAKVEIIIEEASL